MSLPRRRRAPAPSAGENAGGRRAPVADPAARLDGVRVLVVDDEAEARELFTSILENAGAAVRDRLVGRRGAGHPRDRTPRRADVGHRDAGEDGYELASRALARARERATRLDTIAVTAYARTEDRVRALEHGFHWHLAKPVEPSELVSVIASLVYAPAAESRPN